jgi:phosphate transport system substrate-binding protein
MSPRSRLIVADWTGLVHPAFTYDPGAGHLGSLACRRHPARSPHLLRSYHVTSTIRRALVPGIAAAALAVSLTACGSSSDNNTAATDGSSSGSGSGSLSGELNGGGSSAQTAAQQAWQSGFQQANSGVTVNYDPVGSGDGRSGFISGTYAFAGSDAALSTDTSEGASEVAQAKKTCGADALEVPAYVSPIALVFNLSGVSDLNLAPKTVADIFSGKITTWNDPEIAADNSGVQLPATKITPVHRSDDSGTTENFTEWMAATSDGAWSADPSGTWPIQGGASGNGTSGMVSAVKGGDGTIGYADFSQSGGMSVAKIGVGSEFNAPSAAGAAQVLGDSKVESGRPTGDLAIDIDRTDTKSGGYPLFLTSYLIACPSYSDANTGALVKGYLTYAVSDAGQQAAAAAAGSAPLPSNLASQAQQIVAGIK